MEDQLSYNTPVSSYARSATTAYGFKAILQILRGANPNDSMIGGNVAKHYFNDENTGVEANSCALRFVWTWHRMVLI